jgi:kinesin family protein 3/17
LFILGSVSVVDVDTKNNQININKTNSKEPPKTFSYDFVFGIDSFQSSIYEQCAFSLVDNVLDGYNGTIFAYGQTGCGKTYTMMGGSMGTE